jgi:isopenicillin N synthase-like dioxygenase
MVSNCIELSGSLITGTDKLKSTSYRVILPPDSDRYSISYFVAPDPGAVIECLPTCAGPSSPPKYHPITQREYSRMRLMMRRPSKAEIAGGGIANYAPY